MKLWLVPLSLSMVACEPTQPTNMYVIDPTFSGPVVVVWGDPKGASIGSQRRIEIPKNGKAFIRDTAAKSFRLKVVSDSTGGKQQVLPDEGRASPSMVQTFDFYNTTRFGECGGLQGTDVTEDSFFVGRRSDAHLWEAQMRRMRKEALVSTVEHRGLARLAACFENEPEFRFSTIGKK